MRSDDLVQIIAALGLGSGITTIVAAVIAARAQKGKARAEAADLLVSAAERVGKMNQTLDGELRRMRNASDEVHSAVLDHLEGTITRDELIVKLRSFR